MKTSEKNLITEINRIHQLMGVKKLITEQRKLIVPLLGMAQEFLEYVSKRTIDDVATRRAVSELQTAVNAVRASGGRVNPLTSEEYIKIFNNLRRSVDPNIAAKMVEFDRKIVTLIRDNLSEVTDTIEVRELIKRIIDEGGTLDDVNDVLAQLFKKRYGNYVNFATVVDDDGTVIKELMDDYLEGIRKVYVDLGGKLADDVVDAGRGTISREIVELSPVFTRYTNEVGNKMKPLLDEVMALIERRTSTEVDTTRLDELDKEIKTLMDEINDLNTKYVEALEAQIKYGKELGPTENRGRWADIDKYITDVKSKYGDWGVTKVSTPRTEFWSWVYETLYASVAFERKIVKFIKGISIENFSKLMAKGKAAANRADGIREKIKAYERDVNSDLAAKVAWYERWLIPGSSRGIPRELTGPIGTKLVYPNAFGELLKYQTKNKTLRAWLSLVAEKLIIVGKAQLYYSILIPAIRTYQFVKADWGDKNIQKKYGSCITETSKAIKEGKINSDDYDSESMTEEEKTKFFSQFPPCLQTLLQSEEFLKNEFEDFMTRADFWSRGTRGEILGSYFIDALLDVNMVDPLRIFTGTLGNIMVKFFPGLYDRWWESEETGDMTAVEEYLQEQENQIRRDTTRINNEADTLYRSMTDREIEEAVRVLDSLSRNTNIELVPLPSPNQ
jgi:hypothetical protein